MDWIVRPPEKPLDARGDADRHRQRQKPQKRRDLLGHGDCGSRTKARKDQRRGCQNEGLRIDAQRPLPVIEARGPPMAQPRAHAVFVQSQRASGMASAAPTSWAAMKAATLCGAIPAKVSDNDRAIVTAGLANEVEAVNQ